MKISNIFEKIKSTDIPIPIKNQKSQLTHRWINMPRGRSASKALFHRSAVETKLLKLAGGILVACLQFDSRQ